MVFDEKLAGQVQGPRPAQPQTLHVDLAARLAAAQPGESGRAASSRKRRRPLLQVGLQLRGGDVCGGRQGHGFNLPSHVSRTDRLALRALPCAAHSIRQPLGQHQTVLRRTIIVFARADVAPCAGEMNVQGRGHGQLAEETGQARKVGIGQAGSVIALRVRGVVAQDDYGPLTVPKADEGKDWVNGALRFSANRRVLGRRPAGGPDFAVRPQDAPVGGDLLHASLAQAQVRHGLSPGQGLTHRPLQIGDHLPLETTLELVRIGAGFLQDAFRREVTVRRIVLMQRMHGHPARGGGSGSSKSIAKGIVALIGNADPVHGTKHDGLSSA